MSQADLVRQVKLSLADPRKLVEALGLGDVFEPQARGGIIVRCVSHDDRGRPNCSITRGGDGTVRIKCHACGFKGDALTLIAACHKLDMRQDFRQILVLAAELGGNRELAAEIGDGKPRPDRIHIPEPRQLPEVPWPEGASDLWDQCTPVTDSPDATALLKSRNLDPCVIRDMNLARVLPETGALPVWAKYGKRTWRNTSNRLIVRTWDHTGTARGVRAWRVVEGDSPKRLPPSNRKAAGLVLADRRSVGMMLGSRAPAVLWIVEGEPDWLAACTQAPGGHAVIGIGSGGWTAEHAAVAVRARRVIVATHPDLAGDRYAAAITDGATGFEENSCKRKSFDPSIMVKGSVRWRPPKDLDELGSDLLGLMGSVAKWSFIPHALGD